MPRIGPASRRRATAFLAMVVSLCVAVELALQLSDLGLLGWRGLRSDAYAYGAFWSQLLRSWEPNYVLQPWTMFATYAVLHGGVSHLVFNMLTLWSLGQAVARIVGFRGVLGLFVAGALGGAVGHALLSWAPNPMVGASGALFGLVGGLLWFKMLEFRATGRSLRPLAVILFGLIGLNLAMLWMLDGRLAWQAHLGGFVAGVAVAAGRHGLPARA